MIPIEVLERLAKVWRAAMERTDLSDVATFYWFPKGSCGDSSLLLEKFLRDHHIEGCFYVQGESVPEHPDCRSHAWLEYGDVILDITADQFACHPGPSVIVTRDRTWHSHFVEEEREASRIEDYDDFTKDRLLEIYDRVLAAVPPNFLPR